MKSIRHIGIAVSDISRSLSFYVGLLGLKIVSEAHEGGDYISTLCALPKDKSSIRTVKLSAGSGSLLELIQYESYHNRLVVKSEMHWTQTAHIAFQVDDVDLEYRRLSERGVEFLSEPQTSPDNYARVVFLRDPDGIFIELVTLLSLEKKAEEKER